MCRRGPSLARLVATLNIREILILLVFDSPHSSTLHTSELAQQRLWHLCSTLSVGLRNWSINSVAKQTKPFSTAAPMCTVQKPRLSTELVRFCSGCWNSAGYSVRYINFASHLHTTDMHTSTHTHTHNTTMRVGVLMLRA